MYRAKRNNDMEPISYTNAINALNNMCLEMPTLGNRSRLHVEVTNRVLIIRNSAGNQCLISEEHWDLVMSRIRELPHEERYKTSRYGHGPFLFNWNEAPNRVFSIYIPAIVRYLKENG